MEQPASIGERLVAARQAKGWNIRDAEHYTRITAANIRALEAGAYDEFPNLIYAKSFLRLYSRQLGVEIDWQPEELAAPEDAELPLARQLQNAPNLAAIRSARRPRFVLNKPLAGVLAALAVLIAGPIIYVKSTENLGAAAEIDRGAPQSTPGSDSPGAAPVSKLPVRGAVPAPPPIDDPVLKAVVEQEINRSYREFDAPLEGSIPVALSAGDEPPDAPRAKPAADPAAPDRSPAEAVYAPSDNADRESARALPAEPVEQEASPSRRSSASPRRFRGR